MFLSFLSCRLTVKQTQGGLNVNVSCYKLSLNIQQDKSQLQGFRTFLAHSIHNGVLNQSSRVVRAVFWSKEFLRNTYKLKLQ